MCQQLLGVDELGPPQLGDPVYPHRLGGYRYESPRQLGAGGLCPRTRGGDDGPHRLGGRHGKIHFLLKKRRL